jgi:hypothetical protein
VGKQSGEFHFLFSHRGTKLAPNEFLLMAVIIVLFFFSVGCVEF